jgi:hypothetical protein
MPPPPLADKSDKSIDILSSEEMGAMMGDWQDSDIPSPNQGPHKRQASSSPGQGVSDASLLSVDIPVRYDSKRIALAERQVIKVVKAPPPQLALTALHCRTSWLTSQFLSSS